MAGDIAKNALDPRRKAIAQSVLTNQEAQAANVKDSLTGSNKVKDAINARPSSEDLLQKQYDAAAALTKSLDAFSAKATDFTINLNSRIEVVTDGIAAAQSDDFKTKVGGAIDDMFRQIMQIKGTPIPPGGGPIQSTLPAYQ